MCKINCSFCNKEFEIKQRTSKVERVCKDCFNDKNKIISERECKIQNIDCSMAKKYYYNYKTVCYDINNLDYYEYNTNYLTNEEIIGMNYYSKQLLTDRIKFIVNLIVFNKLNRDLVISNPQVKKYIEYGICSNSLEDFADYIIKLPHKAIC